MFERYTERARRAIFFARYEASQYGSPYIESEHLLLGLLREDKVFASRLPLGAAESIREQIDRSVVPHKKTSTSVDLPLSNECKRALAYAAEEAERRSDAHIGTEHLLLGLLREENCFGAKLLKQFELGPASLVSPKDCPLAEAWKAQAALRQAAGAPTGTITRAACIAMVGSEIRALRHQGHSDAAIAEIIHGNSELEVTAAEITYLCPPGPPRA